MAFRERFNDWKVPEGKLGVVWLGQAGFMFKLGNGKVIMLDPYLTDYTFKAIGEAGFIRMTAPLFDPEDIHADYLLSSHEHQDHLDLDALPVLATPETKVFANSDSIKMVKDAGINVADLTQLEAGDCVKTDDFTLYATKADHGALAPRAMGFMLDFGFVKVYYSGDTCLNREVLKPSIDMHPELALLPINGAYGNLNAVDASLLARDMKCKYCIPHHFWTFPAHNAPMGDPSTALRYFPEIAPDCRLDLVSPGQLLLY